MYVKVRYGELNLEATDLSYLGLVIKIQVIVSCALECLIILGGPQCSGKTKVSQWLRNTLDEKHKKQTYLLKLNEINTERFKKALNEALDKRYRYVIGELNYGDSHSTDPRT
jgi:pantothenate kinase-related protein Tda10